MSRAMIGGAVAVVIAVLTAVSYFMTTSNFESQVRKDAEHRVVKADELLRQNARLKSLDLLKKAEAFAQNDALLAALKESGDARERAADRVFQTYITKLPPDQKPDFLALVDANGDLVALLDVSRPAPDSWKNCAGGGECGADKLIYPALTLALAERQITSDIWHYQQLKALMEVGVAPIIDDVDEVAGAVVIAYSLTTEAAQRQSGLLGLEVAYVYDDQVFATSFRTDNDKEDVGKKDQLGKKLADNDLVAKALSGGEAPVVSMTIGDEYLATAGRLPRFSSKQLPSTYPEPMAGAVVLMSVTAAREPFSGVGITILVLGLGAIVVALLAMMLTARSILHPIDEIEVGVNDIINGNIDRTFEPVGSDLDGLANALNVMLARLLGRPEPGEEEYDEAGNLIGAANMDFDTENMSEKDAEAVKLAAEPEQQYYQRLFDEYLAARQQVGESTDSIQFEAFKAKMRLTEGNLKKKKGYRAVRFKVIVQDNKVILKPVPIV